MALNINGTTGISGVDGSASAPAVTGTDSNTGINFGSDTVNINTGGTTRATVDSSGNMLIGATSASGKLHVEDSGENNVYFVGNTSTSGARLILQNKNSTANSFTGVLGADAGGQTTASVKFYSADNANNEGFLAFETRPSGGVPTERMRITSQGRIRMPEVYSTTGSSMRDVQIESNGTLAGLSSITASKTNITDITDISWLYKLKPKTFNFRKKTTDILTGENTYLDEAETEKAYGLLAEDVETVNKDFCFYNKDSEGNDVLAGVYYKIMVVPLIKAVQDLKAENTALAARVTALEAG